MSRPYESRKPIIDSLIELQKSGRRYRFLRYAFTHTETPEADALQKHVEMYATAPSPHEFDALVDAAASECRWEL